MLPEDPLETEPLEKEPSRLLAYIKPMAVVIVIVAVECFAVAVLMPSSADTQQLGQQLAAARVAGPDGQPAADTARRGSPPADLREVDLGSHHVAVFQTSSNTTLRIDLHLYATVLANDLYEFERLYPIHQHRLSEQVHSTFRAAEITDLTDAGLGLIKRQILEKSNRTLGKPLLQGVVFSQFSFLEQ